MAKMKELEPIVTEILQSDIKCRKDDFRLIRSVYTILCPDIMGMTFSSVMVNHKALKLPSFESITRSRRKVQELHPELRDAEMVEIRVDEQKEILDYVFDNQ